MYCCKFVLITLLLILASPSAAAGEEVGSIQLIEQAKFYDTHEIVYSGEVVGDILSAGDHVWLNVSDGSSAIGVWATRELAEAVQVAGRYSQKGDVIRVAGRFSRACPEHGGDMDLHAQSIVLVKHGFPVGHAVPAWKVWLAVWITVPALLLLIGVVLGSARKRTMKSTRFIAPNC